MNSLSLRNKVCLHCATVSFDMQVDILDLKPRPNPGKGGTAFGWTGTPWW